MRDPICDGQEGQDSMDDEEGPQIYKNVKILILSEHYNKILYQAYSNI